MIEKHDGEHKFKCDKCDIIFFTDMMHKYVYMYF